METLVQKQNKTKQNKKQSLFVSCPSGERSRRKGKVIQCELRAVTGHRGGRAAALRRLWMLEYGIRDPSS